MQIVPSQNPVEGGPIIINDARLYRARTDHGRLNHKLTEPMLRRIMHNAPILDTHSHVIGPIGRVTGWRYDPASRWVHISGEIDGRDKLGDWRYNNLRRRFMIGQLKAVSISVAMELDKKTKLFRPETCRLVEVSVCNKGKHKKTDILTLEASADSQVKLELNGGTIEKISMATLATGGLQAATNNNQHVLEELADSAREAGVELSDEEVQQLGAANDGGILAAATIARKIAEKTRSHSLQMTAQQKEFEELKKFKEDQHKRFLEQRKPEVEEMIKRFEATVPEESRDAFKKLISSLGTSVEAESVWGVLKLFESQVVESQTKAAELQKTHESTAKDLHELQRRTKQQEAQKPSSASANKHARDVSPPRKSSTNNRPENLSKSMAAPGEVLIEADETAGNQGWIDRLFGRAYQSTAMQAVEDDGLSMVREIMSESGFRYNANTTLIPPLGKQGFRKSAEPARWGRTGY